MQFEGMNGGWERDTAHWPQSYPKPSLCCSKEFPLSDVSALTCPHGLLVSLDAPCGGLTWHGLVLCLLVVQPPSRVWFFATPRTTARQASLTLTISQSLPKFMSIASVMPSSHLILSPTWHINKFPYLKGLNLLQIAWLSGLSPRKPLTHLCSCSVT